MTDRHIILTDKKLLDVKMIHEYLSNTSYWAKGRNLDTVKKSIENSLCFGVYLNHEQVGFARVVTDYAVFGWIMDVFILEYHQGKGLGKKLMENIVSHSDLAGLKRWGLNTFDAHMLYSKYGFEPIKKPDIYMEKLC